MIQLRLNDDEAILLDALLKYASTLIKPPLDTDFSTLQDVRLAAEAIVIAAPAEVMQRLVWKLGPALEPMMLTRKATIEEWNKARI